MRSGFKQTSTNMNNLIKIKKHGYRDHANFTIATCNVQSIKNKESQVSDLILEYGLDALVITETWLNNKSQEWKDSTLLDKNNLKLLTSDRTNGKGGGLALITKRQYQVKQVYSANLDSLGSSHLEISANNNNVILYGIYHLPPHLPISPQTPSSWMNSLILLPP